MLERMDNRDRRFVFVCIAIAIVCGSIAWRYFGRAFPEASIQFAVNRSESEDIARGFLDRIQDTAGDAKHAVIFDFDEPTKTYLERELGLERAQAVYGEEVRLWRWSHRWFRPGQKEEVSVDVTAAGEIARYEHVLAEDAPGATVPPDSARMLAERFLADRMGVDLAGYEFVEGSTAQRPQRLDHTFTWKRRGLELGTDATYRTQVEVAGDRVVGYDEHLDIPQVWQDDYERLRARNELAALVATVFLVLTVVAMIGVLVLRVRDRDVPWRTVLGFGFVAFVLQLLVALNTFDLQKFEYETQDGYASFVTQFLLQSVLAALAGGGLIVLFTGAAEPVYRERHPEHLALSSYFSRRGLRTKSFFKQLLLGITLMFFFAAYQAVFYLVAARFGAWAPLEVPFNNLLNTAIPWAVVLFIGFFPAVSEEFLSRMFSLPFLGKHLPRIGLRGRAATIVAVLLASFIWGFAHSNYPNQPYWIRGAEVGLAGVLVSVVMLRWGIMATLVWHYTVDAFYTSLLMLRSGNPYFMISGAVPAGLMLVPLVVALALYVRHRGFEPSAGLNNGQQPAGAPAVPASAAPEAPAGDAPAGSAPLAGPVLPASRRALAAGALIAAALLCLHALPVERPGDGIRIQSDRAHALAAGRAALQALGADPEGWRTAEQLASRYEPPAGRYVLEQGGVARLNALHTGPIRTPVWRLRYFRPDEREEWILNLRADSTLALWAFQHDEPDTAGGDTVSMEMAQAIAGDRLREHGLDPASLDLKESSAEQQKRRIDHSFEWEQPDSTLGEAGVRYRVVTHGSRVAAFRPYLHLPEAWLRAWQSKSVLQRIVWFASRAVFGLIVFALVATFVQQVRARRTRWRAGIVAGLGVGALSVLLSALRWRSDVLWTYETSMPFQLFTTGALVSLFLQFALTAAIAGVLVATALAVRPQSLAPWTGGRTMRFVRDGAIAALVAVALQAGVARLATVLAGAAPHLAVPQELPVFATLARPMPWLDLFAGLLRYWILALPAIIIVLHAARQFLGVPRALAVAFTAALLFAADGTRSWSEFGLQAAIALAGAAAGTFIVLRLLRGNELAWLVAIVLARGLASVPSLWQQPAGRGTAAVTCVLVLVLAAGLVVLAARRATHSHQVGSTNPAA